MIDERELLEEIKLCRDEGYYYSKDDCCYSEEAETAYYEALNLVDDLIVDQPKVGEWIPFELEYDEEQKREILMNPLPDEYQEILVTDGDYVWMDTFLYHVDGYYLDSGIKLISRAIAWMPKPEPWKGEQE